MDALISAFEKAGFAVRVDDEGTTIALIGEEGIPFSIAERVRRDERPPTDDERAEMRRNPWKKGPFYAYSPIGQLTLQIGGDWRDGQHRQKWTDGKPRPVEECLYSVARGLLISADSRAHRRNDND